MVLLVANEHHAVRDNRDPVDSSVGLDAPLHVRIGNCGRIGVAIGFAGVAPVHRPALSGGRQAVVVSSIGKDDRADGSNGEQRSQHGREPAPLPVTRSAIAFRVERAAA